MTTNYFNTFIGVADDCPANTGTVPPRKEPKSVAQIQYDMLIGNPYHYTSDEVLYVANGERRGISREDFFSKGQPCFRASPLTKQYGWGVHSDKDGKIALYAVESAEYRQLAADTTLKQVKAMRNKRA